MIYLAGPCDSEHRTLMTNIATALRRTRYEVYCPFELKIPNAWDMSQEKWGQEVFNKDVEAINKADIFLMISFGRMSTAGTNWEQGYAFAKGKRIIVFQVTDSPTSLMTYASSHIFRVSDERFVCGDILEVLAEVDRYSRGDCPTTLT